MYSAVLSSALADVSRGIVGCLAFELIGVPLGLISGYYGGKVDQVIMRALDLLLAFPALLLAILIVATFGSGLINAAIALGIVYVPAIARVVRSVALVQRQQLYVEAARALGYDDRRILFRHILPNVASPIFVQSTIDLAYAILDIAALSF
jgi:peptide/nickel transport system permease protein